MFGLIKKRDLVLLLIMLATAIGLGCKETRVTKEQVLETIGSVEHKLDWLDYRLRLEHWSVINGQPSDSIEFFQALHSAYYRSPEALNVLKNNRALIKSDEIASRKYDLIFNHLLMGQVESSLLVAQLRDSVLVLSATNPPSLVGGASSQAGLDQVLAFGSNATLREDAFRAKFAGSEQQTEMMGQLIRLRNQEAARLGYNDFYAMTFPTDGLALDEYRKLLDELEEATAAPYQALLDRIGSGLVEPWNLTYALSANLSELSRRPLIDSQWTVIKGSFKDLGYDLDKLPIYFQLTAIPTEPAEVTQLTIIGPHDLRLFGNLGSGLDLTGQTIKAVARLIHDYSISETEPLFVNRIDGAWTEGVAELFAGMVNDSAWLAKYLNLSPSAIATVIAAQRELELVKVRSLLLKLNFEYEAYRSRKPDLNRLYWDLCDRIMRVKRHDDIAPWAADMNLAANPIRSQNLLLGKIIAAQTKAYLAEVNGTVVGNPETRSFLLQNYMRFGARYPWIELLERGTGAELDEEELVKGLIAQ